MRTINVSLSLALFAACGNVQGTPPDAPEVPTADFTIALLTSSATVPLDGKSRVEVEITRTGGFTGAVNLAGATLPSGITVTPATIAEGATTAEVIVQGAAPLTIGSMVSFTLEGSGDGVPAHQVMVNNAAVTGQPGALDNTFGAGASGLATIKFGNDDGGAFTHLDVIAGNVLVTGFGVGGLGEVRWSTTRFTAAGLVDATWANGTLVISSGSFPPSGSGDFAMPAAVGRQTDGLSIIIGTNENNSNTAPCPCTSDIGVIKYNLNGSPVGFEFGTGPAAGSSQIDLNGGNETVTTGVVLPDSSIIAAGSTNGHWMVAGITQSGTLNTAGFAAPTGFERLVIGQGSTATSAVADSAGRLVVAGQFVMGGQLDTLIVRYLANGAHDSTFGAAGQVVIAGPSSENAIALRAANGKLLLATSTSDAGANFHRVRRYSEDGAVDTTFGRDGLAEIPATGALTNFAVASDGSILLLTDEGGRAGLTRLTRKGELDTLFGAAGTGSVQIFIGDGGAPRGIAVYDEHRIIIAGGNMGGVPGPGTNGIVGRIWR